MSTYDLVTSCVDVNDVLSDDTTPTIGFDISVKFIFDTSHLVLNVVSAVLPTTVTIYLQYLAVLGVTNVKDKSELT